MLLPHTWFVDRVMAPLDLQICLIHPEVLLLLEAFCICDSVSDAGMALHGQPKYVQKQFMFKTHQISDPVDNLDSVYLYPLKKEATQEPPQLHIWTLHGSLLFDF